MTEWKPRNKYEVASGLFIGSEIGDIDREKRPLMKKWLDTGDKDAYAEGDSLTYPKCHSDGTGHSLFYDYQYRRLST